MSVLAPFSNSSFTPSTSPAFTAKNSACMGTRHRLGSAPRCSSRLMVSHLFLLLQRSDGVVTGWRGADGGLDSAQLDWCSPCEMLRGTDLSSLLLRTSDPFLPIGQPVGHQNTASQPAQLSAALLGPCPAQPCSH